MRNSVLAMVLATMAGAAAAQTAPLLSASPMPGRGMRMMHADTDGDGFVTRAEAAAQADAQFDGMDANRDGKVTGDEMRAAWQARGGNGGSHGTGGRAGIGARGDLTATREDFRARALARFDRADANRDGRVDAAEMDAMRQRRMNRGSDTTAAASPQQQ